MPKTTEKAKTVKVVKTGKPLSKKELEVAAYYHWQERGCPINDDLTDWVEAEKEIGKPASGTKSPKK
jgi:hypothetical protein